MIFLDNTNRTIELSLLTSVVTTELNYTINYAENGSNPFVIASNNGTSNGTSRVTLVSAPASGLQRQIKSIMVFNADVSAATVTIEYNDNGTRYKIFSAPLFTGETLHYSEFLGFYVTDIFGRLKINTATVGGMDDIYSSHMHVAANSGVGAFSGGSSDAPALFPIGFATRSYKKANILFRITTAGTSITYQEIGIFRGRPHHWQNSLAQPGSMTVCGYVDASGVSTSLGLHNLTIPLSGIDPGDFLWIGAAGKSTGTAPIIRGTLVTAGQACLYCVSGGGIGDMRISTGNGVFVAPANAAALPWYVVQFV